MEYGLIAVWWVTYVGLALFGLPIAAWLCSSLPGRGAGFSLGMSFAIITLAAFWVGFLALGWVALFAGLSALAVCAVLAVRAGVDIDRRAAGEALVVFTLVYAAVLVVRSADPGITPGGEKFLDFGLMVSLYRSTSLPPEDFWFAGKSLIYYYGGHFLASLLTRLTGTHPWYGFNLAMAGFYGALAAGAYELAGAVAVGRRRARDSQDSALTGVTGRGSILSGRHVSTLTASQSTDGGRNRENQGQRVSDQQYTTDRPDRTAGQTDETASGHTRLRAGATALFFTLCASNLSTAARMLVRRLPATIRDDAAQALASVHQVFTVQRIFTPIPAQGYQFKIAGRIIPPEASNPTYNPFPLFAIVRGDIRPYLLSTPFLLCVAGLCYAYYRTPEADVRRRRALVLGAVPAVGGFMALVNTWSLAVVLGLLWLTLTFAPTTLRSLLPSGRIPVLGHWLSL